MATVEQAWWTANREPQVTQTADRLVLWNYPVGRTELAGTHAAAVRSFLHVFFLAPELTGNAVAVCGHASATGEAAANVALATGRANNVAKLLTDLGFKGFEVTAAGSSQPADTAPTGQAMARNRRVELTKSAVTDITPGPVPAPVSTPPKAAKEPRAKPTGGAETAEVESLEVVGGSGMVFQEPAVNKDDTGTTVIWVSANEPEGDDDDAAPPEEETTEAPL